MKLDICLNSSCEYFRCFTKGKTIIPIGNNCRKYIDNLSDCDKAILLEGELLILKKEE